MYTEAELIRMKTQIYGYEKGRIPIGIDPYIMRVASLLVRLPENGKVSGKKWKIDEVSRTGADFLSSMFTLHEVKYAGCEILEKLRECGAISSTQGIIDFLEVNSRLVSPTEIPIELVQGHSMVGNIAKSIILLPDADYLKRVPIIMSAIRLGDNLTALSAATYAHELIHSQLESVKGAVKNYQNKELLPIFVEKIAVDEIDKTGKYSKKSMDYRMRYLIERIALVDMFNKKGPSEGNGRTEAVESSVIIVSTLKALNLYDRYVSGSEADKKLIIKGIQDIFDGQQTLEVFLENLDITLENSASCRLVSKYL